MGGPIDIAQRGWQFDIYDHDHFVTKVRCMDIPDSDGGDFSCRRAVDSSSYLSVFLSDLNHVVKRGPETFLHIDPWYFLYCYSKLL